MACVVCNRVNVDRSCPGMGLDAVPTVSGAPSRPIRWRLEQILHEPVNDMNTSWMCMTCFSDLEQIESYYQLLNRYKKMYKESVSKRDLQATTSTTSVRQERLSPPTESNTGSNILLNTSTGNVMALNKQPVSVSPPAPAPPAPPAPAPLAHSPLQQVAEHPSHQHSIVCTCEHTVENVQDTSPSLYKQQAIYFDHNAPINLKSPASVRDFQSSGREVTGSPDVGMDLSSKSANRSLLNQAEDLSMRSATPEKKAVTSNLDGVKMSAEDLRKGASENGGVDLTSISGLNIIETLLLKPPLVPPPDGTTAFGTIHIAPVSIESLTGSVLSPKPAFSMSNSRTYVTTQGLDIPSAPNHQYSLSTGLYAAEFPGTTSSHGCGPDEHGINSCTCFEQSQDEDGTGDHGKPQDCHLDGSGLLPAGLVTREGEVLQSDIGSPLPDSGARPAALTTNHIQSDHPDLNLGQEQMPTQPDDDMLSDDTDKRKRGRPRKIFPNHYDLSLFPKRGPGRPRRPLEPEKEGTEEKKPIEFMCLACNKKFDSGIKLRQHVRVHRQQGRLSCPTCRKTFIGQNNLNEHMRTHAGEKAFSCETCGRIFATMQHLKTHSLVHSSERPHKCGTCGKGFTQSCTLKIHEMTHTDDRPFNCNVCCKGFTRSTDMKTHMRTHTDDRPFMCTACGKCFKRSDNLKMHMRIHSGERPFSCDACGKKFLATTALKVHMRTHTGERPFPCHVCGKRFRQSGALSEHLRTHTGQKAPRRCMCWQCGKAFTDNSQLKNHMMTHTGEKRFLCNICNKGFILAASLKQHMMNHSGERPHVCKVCNKGFTRQGSLVAHMRTHTGERPYYCEECGKSFREAGALKRHKRTHTGDRPYVCEVCAETFTQSHHLKEHLKMAHAIDKKGMIITASKMHKIHTALMTNNNDESYQDGNASMDNSFSNGLSDENSFGAGVNDEAMNEVLHGDIFIQNGSLTNTTPSMITTDMFDSDSLLNGHVMEAKDLSWQPRLNNQIYSQ